jgi:hypothetical protein
MLHPITAPATASKHNAPRLPCLHIMCTSCTMNFCEA